ncbi:hypothetical protein [Comamonas kerstersii]|uniref:hypothetical protein n=1 Tax=Comamonas kerstersii TaxID=225992 RepID=UPI0013B04BD3|nr:hypothetical protein [Comamonas kerstersii]
MSSATRKREGHFLSLQKVTRLPGRDPASEIKLTTDTQQAARSHAPQFPPDALSQPHTASKNNHKNRIQALSRKRLQL